MVTSYTNWRILLACLFLLLVRSPFDLNGSFALFDPSLASFPLHVLFLFENGLCVAVLDLFLLRHSFFFFSHFNFGFGMDVMVMMMIVIVLRVECRF
jgi:hypothetical protein